MPRYDHLQLIRLPERLERRKGGGGGPPPPRDLVGHSAKLRTDLDAAVETQRNRRKPEFIDPSLILRVQMTGALLEEQWEQLGLTVVSSDADRTLVLFASSDDMRDFRNRLDAYQSGPPPGQKTTPYNAFIGMIEAISTVEPRDRIGVRFREEGFGDPVDFENRRIFLIDLELWDIGDRSIRERKLKQVVAYIQARGGEVFDQYIGPSITLARARLEGDLLQTLLSV
jgi:hypothetical protein